MIKTKVTKESDIKREWKVVDATSQVLGRLSTKVASLLIGKSKPMFTSAMDVGDYVVVINADKVVVTGGKEKKKIYSHHSGYPGSLKQASYSEVFAKDPALVVIQAVSGMIPKNKLRNNRIKRLKVFSGDTHPYKHLIQSDTSN